MTMAGQTINDRLLAARHSLAGQGLAKSVCKATTEECIGPKKKHLDYLVHCTNEPNVSIPHLANLLIERSQNANWVVVYKSLITTHHLMAYGNERFMQYLASSNSTFNLSNFLDKGGVQDGGMSVPGGRMGYDMSPFIRRYAKYLNEKSLSYRAMAFDFCKVKRGKEEGSLRSMNADKLLKTLPVLQAQLDGLLEFDCQANDLTNGVINMSFMLLFRDLIRLFACYNDGIINLLEKYFDMNKKQARDALDLYKKFLVRMDRVGEFLKVAENVGIDKGDIPDLTKAPSSLLDALEQHLATLEGRRTSAANTPTQTARMNVKQPNETQIKIMVMAMKENPDMVRPFKKPNTERSKPFWSTLLQKLNSHGPPQKKPFQWRLVWRKYKQDVQKKMRQHRNNDKIVLDTLELEVQRLLRMTTGNKRNKIKFNSNSNSISNASKTNETESLPVVNDCNEELRSVNDENDDEFDHVIATEGIGYEVKLTGNDCNEEHKSLNNEYNDDVDLEFATAGNGYKEEFNSEDGNVTVELSSMFTSTPTSPTSIVALTPIPIDIPNTFMTATQSKSPSLTKTTLTEDQQTLNESNIFYSILENQNTFFEKFCRGLDQINKDNKNLCRLARARNKELSRYHNQMERIELKKLKLKEKMLRLKLKKYEDLKSSK